jgi:hypothetical protein
MRLFCGTHLSIVPQILVQELEHSPGGNDDSNGAQTTEPDNPTGCPAHERS